MPRRSPRKPSRQERTLAEGLGRAIKVIRANRGLSRRDLAERSGLSYSYLAEIENSAKSPSSGALAAIAEGLGMEASELVEQAVSWGAASESAGDGAAASSSPPRRARSGGDQVVEFGVQAGPPRGKQKRGVRERMLSLGAKASPPRGSRSASAADEVLETRAFSAAREPRAEIHGAPEYLAFGESRSEIPAALLDEIEAGNCTAFVGAGFSAAADLPAWKELLSILAADPAVEEEAAAHVARCVERGSAHLLDEAAQVLEDALGRERFLERLNAHLGDRPLTPAIAERVRWLRGIPFRAILTTNFDRVLAGSTTSHDAYRHALRPADYRWWDRRYWDETAGAYTLKLHGDVTQKSYDEGSVVLTRRDYRRRLYEDPAYTAFLRAIMATTTVLYMGFSFEDAYLNELRSEILALLGQSHDSAPVAYAIVNDVPEETRRNFRRHEGIEILSYDTQGGSDFSGFDERLRAIYERTNPLLRFARYLEDKRILWVDPHPENNELAFEHLTRAARTLGRAQTSLVMVPTAEEGLQELERAESRARFDLVITHWGEDAARDEDGGVTSTAERLLQGIRSRDLHCAVVVFGFERDVERRKRTALGLGAQAYCYEFEDLLQAIERVFSPATSNA